MSQTVTDTSPLEERVYKSDAPRGGYFLDKELYSIPLPWMLPFWADNDQKPYMEIANNLDKVIDAYYDFIGKDNTYLSSRLFGGGREGTMIISHCNMDHYDLFVDTNIGVPINREMSQLPDLGYVDYNQDNEITMTFRGAFNAIVEDLLGYQAGPIHGEDEFDYFVNELNRAIDALFVEQGFQPTPDKRHNLIGLCQNLTNRILEKEEVQRLIGVTPGTVALDNPNLVRLAAKGVTHTMIRIFCIAGVFPDSTEDLEDLASMPVEMLHDIWIGREKD